MYFDLLLNVLSPFFSSDLPHPFVTFVPAQMDLSPRVLRVDATNVAVTVAKKCRIGV